ncbi:tetratricopeptide repeat protein [Prolixibacter bellariivorans]|nr:tetratricopeptide repeat protein [Prolixibacter bellariivorans]
MKTFMSENKMQMRQIILITMILFLAVPVFAQKERKFIREGNRDFAKGLEDTTSLDTVSFSKAEVAYRRALQEKPDNFQWKFNLADALYKQAKPAKAAEEFEQLTKETDNAKDKAKVYHNLGNSLLAQKKIDESIDAYKKSLRLNPNDMETKYNLAYAEKMKQQQKNKKKNKQNQQDKNNKDKNKNKQDKNKQNKDQNKNNKNKQNQDQKKNQDQNKQNQNKQNQKNQNQQQQQQPQQNKISKQNAEQMLQALQNDEKKTQEKVRKLKAKKAQQYKIEKDW